MYWPTATTRLVNTPSPLDAEPLIRVKQSRKGNFFACLTRDGLGVWDIRPTVLQAAIIRTKASLERFGLNQDVFWAHDGRGVIILTDTSHLLFYQLIPTSRPSYDFPGPSSPGPGEGDVVMGWELRSLGTAFVMGGCQSLATQQSNMLLTLRHPPSILSVPYPLPSQLVTPSGSHFPPSPLDGDTESQVECDIWDLNNARDWLIQDQDSPPPIPRSMGVTKVPNSATLHTLTMNDGRAYVMYPSNQLAQVATSEAQRVQLNSAPKYIGQSIHPPPLQQDVVKQVEALGLVEDRDDPPAVVEDHAAEVAVNPRFGLIAVGFQSGKINIVSLPRWPGAPKLSHTFDLKFSANLRMTAGCVTSLAWTGDGYCLGVGYERGWAVWSMGGRLGGWAIDGEEGSHDPGVSALFWVPGNLELLLLRPAGNGLSQQLEVIPFVKSATASQQSPDNTRYAFLQMDDRVLVYRGADQPDMSVINPESDVWQSIKIPATYIASNWPIRYASISSDGKLIAVAGRRGLTHYSASSGRWKLFLDERQERELTVRGGLLWFHHVLIAAADVEKTHQLRLYSRDLDLTEVLHSQTLSSPVLVMTLLDNSLLVYTADNTLYHFLILPTQTSIKLHLCGSISFRGIVQVPSRVRALSWLVPLAQKNLGDPADDLIVATIIFLVDGKLVLLRPRRARTDEVRYDMQILADRIEVYWTHLHGVGTLENSLWGYDGANMRIWLDALTIEETRVDTTSDSYESVQESVKLRLDFYPLSILMDKGIIIGVDYETSTRTLPFPIYKISTGTHLFLPQFLRYHLSTAPPSLSNALTLASNYQSLVYFAHSLEILLHSVLEDESTKSKTDDNDAPSVAVLPTVILFLDYFDESLDVVVACARKTEIDRWKVLFDTVGSPRDLFENCLQEGKMRTAASYLLVLHNLEEMDDVEDTIRLLRQAIEAKEFRLCKELLRFLHSLDETGAALRAAVTQVGIIDIPSTAANENGHVGETLSHTLLVDSLIDASASHDTPKAPQPPTLANGIKENPTNDTDGNAPKEKRSAGGKGHQRVNSHFDLDIQRVFKTPPSPRTVEQFAIERFADQPNDCIGDTGEDADGGTRIRRIENILKREGDT